jgi:flavin reductase (DIM6/NTAB) family NADH-FMN oxidoreductase RutF
VRHRLSANGSPVIEGVAAAVECTLKVAHDVGEHVMLVAEVTAVESDAVAQPLLSHNGRYRQLA